MKSARPFVLLIPFLMLSQSYSQVVAQLIPKEPNKADSGDVAPPETGPPVTIYSLQSQQGGVDNVGFGGIVYSTFFNVADPSHVFVNFNAADGLFFPGVMLADNMGLGDGFQPGVDHITSYSLAMLRSSADPQPGLADFHVELWDGDPFCQIDTPAGGFSCAPIDGTGADFIDIPSNTNFIATHVLPKGVSPPNQRVWMVVSGSQTANPSPCRLGWKLASRARVGDNEPGNRSLMQDDANNGGDGPAGQGTCCQDGSSCDADSLCPPDPSGEEGHCSDGFAESASVFTSSGFSCGSGFACTNFTAAIRSAAATTISLVPVSTNAGTIAGREVVVPGGKNSIELEIRIGDWDPEGMGTLLRALEVAIDPTGFTSGLQGTLDPTLVPCESDGDCLVAFGGACTFTGEFCESNDDCPLYPGEVCRGSTCYYPPMGPEANTFCEPGFFYTGRHDFVLSKRYYVVAVNPGNPYWAFGSGTLFGEEAPSPSPFPADGLYSGTLRLNTSVDCRGTFTVGFIPHLDTSLLMDSDYGFIPLVGFLPAKITCEIGRCCFDLQDTAGCWDDVTQEECDAAPGLHVFSPGGTCADPCGECTEDAECQDGVFCNGTEVCDPYRECQTGIPPCNDGVDCTTDVCNESDSSCTYTPVDSVCDDAVFCNGQERCDPVTGCQDRSVPCSPEVCNEDTDTCAPPSIPTVSVWGVLILAGMLLVLAKVCFRARQGVCM